MTNPSITTLEAARCLSILETADEPIVAAALAARLHLSGGRESQRRHVRAIVKHLRDNCDAWIIGTLQGGYFLTEDSQLWRDYLEGRQIDAKRILGQTHKRKKMLTYANGQGALFGPVVTCGIG